MADPAEKWGAEGAPGNADGGWQPEVHEGGGETSEPTGNLRPAPSKGGAKRTPKTDDYRPPTNPPASSGPSLRSHDGGGQTTPRDKSHLSQAPTAYDHPGNADTEPYNPDSVRAGRPGDSSEAYHGGAPTAGDIAEQEAAGADAATETTIGGRPDLKVLEGGAGEVDPGASLYTGAAKKKKKNFWGRLSRNQKFAGLGLGGGVIGGLIALMVIFVPIFRLEGYLSSIDNRVYSAAENAISKRLERLTINYFDGTLAQCGNKVVTGGCKADYSKYGKVKQLYNLWRDSKVDSALLQEMDLRVEFSKNPPPGESAYRLINASTGDELAFKDGKLIAGKNDLGSRELAKDFNRNVIKKMYPHKSQILKRRAVRKSIEYRFGMKFWCMFACKQRDSIDRKIKDPVTKLKYKLVERVIYPFSTKYGVIMDCILSGGGSECSADALRKRGIKIEDLPDKEVENLGKYFVDKAGNPIDRKLIGIITERLLAKIMSDLAAKQIVGSIPLAGQIYLALTVIDMFDQMDHMIKDHTLSKFYADLIARQYVVYYTSMESANDEMKAGQSTLAQTGAVANQFQKGQPAETSRLYQAYNDPERPLKQVAANDSSGLNRYTCPSGDPIPANQLVCPEKQLTHTFAIEDIRNNKLVDGYANTFNQYRKCPGVGPIHVPKVFGHCGAPREFVHPILQFINKVADTVIGPLAGAALKAISLLPGVGKIVSYATKYTGELLHAFMQKIFPLPINLDSYGRDLYEGLEAGGEFVASEFGRGGTSPDGQTYGLGGAELTPGQQLSIDQAAEADRQTAYKQSSLYGKLTDLDYSQSLGNHLLAAAPLSFGDFLHKFGSAVAKPFTSVFFTIGHAHAGGNVLPVSAFGVKRMGYSLNDKVYDVNPAKYTDEYCAALTKKWEASMKEDPITGFQEPTMENPCLLETAAMIAGSGDLTQNDALDDSIGSYKPISASPAK